MILTGKEIERCIATGDIVIGYSELFGRKAPFNQAEYACLSQAAKLRGIVVLCLPDSAQILRNRISERKSTGLDTDKQSDLDLCEKEWDLWAHTLKHDFIYRSRDKEDLRTAVNCIVGEVLHRNLQLARR